MAGTDGYFKHVNPAFSGTLGYSERELLSRPFIEFVHRADRQRTLDELALLNRGFPAVHFENRYRCADGSYRWLLWNSTSRKTGGLLYACAIDITARKRDFQTLQRLNRKLAVLSSRLAMAGNEERRRIARGMHDEVGQVLAAAKLKLETLDGLSLRDGSGQLSEAIDLISQAIESTKTLTFELSDVVLERMGLRAALQRLAHDVRRREKLLFDLDLGDISEKDLLCHSKRTVLYRTGRELIHNVVKHAGARMVRILLLQAETELAMVIEDDGCGFEVTTHGGGLDGDSRFGLFSIRQQLDYIGGRFTIESTPGNGTRAMAAVPL